MNEIDGYRITTTLYESGNSTVYRGYDQQDNKPVILKVLKRDAARSADLTRYRQEYEIIRSLDLPGVIQAYDLKPHPQGLVLILEDFGGSALKTLMAHQHPALNLGLGSALPGFLRMAIHLADILAQVHAAHVIHKDINPANIALNPETQQLKLIDFGIASVLSRENPTLKHPNVLEGTLAYISPEQTGRMNRVLDYRSDFYSLGVTFYELLTGQLPFNTTDALELVHCHIAKQPLPVHDVNPQIDPVVSQIVMKLLAKTAEERYQNARGLQADLERCRDQLATTGKIVPFPLGQQDRGDQLQIPQKLYGRESEIATLLATFARIAPPVGAVGRAIAPRSRVEMMLVAGYSGIGKSVLVQELYRPITAARGYWIAGKFGQFQRNIPYSAFVHAFEGLVQQLLTESAASLARWRDRLLTALGKNGQVIIDVIPQVELIIGKQPALPEIGATETQNRFNLVFQKFIRVFCALEHPLVIFLDDLQWADSATLKLLALMMTDPETNSLFLIGAYRDHEVSGTHPLVYLWQNLAQTGATIHQIDLLPLALEHVSQLIADTLQGDRAIVQPLAELVVQKTNGNPFFVNEFLKALYADQLLTFNPQSRCWQWDIQQISALNITDNVVELMIRKLQKLPNTHQQVLASAACMGAEFDLNTLAMICERPAIAVFADLKQAIRAGLVLSGSDLDEDLLIQQYRFCHDRIQQAAYALIPPPDQQAMHGKIGYLLWQRIIRPLGSEAPANCPPEIDPETTSEQIFEIVDHLNQGGSSPHCPLTWAQIARLYLMAGQRATLATAYSSAGQYLRQGLALLPPDSWHTHYELTLTLLEETVEAEYLDTHFAAAETLADQILEQASQQLDRIKAYELKIQLYTAQNHPLQALETGLQALTLLGIDREANRSAVITVPALSDIENSREMTDPAQLAAMRILMAICPSAYFAKPEDLSTIVLTMVQLTQHEGYSPLAAYGYVWYAALCAAQGEIATGYQAGKLALALVDKYHATELRAKVINLFCALVRHWREPASRSIPALQEGIQSGLDTGDNEYACYCVKDYCVHLFLTGQPLEFVEAQMAQSVDLLLKLKQEYSIYQTNIWRQVGLNLLGFDLAAPDLPAAPSSELPVSASLVPNPQAADPQAVDPQAADPRIDRTQLVGKSFNEATAISTFITANNRTLLFITYLAKLHLSYLFKDYRAALSHAIAAVDYIDAVMGFMYVAVHNFYYSLALLAQSAGDPSHRHQVTTNQAQMQQWAESAPANFQHKYDLVAAEMARVCGHPWQAAQLYERAIQGAHLHGYVQEEALAWELAAEFYLEQDMSILAQTHLQAAHDGYIRWQAWTKLTDLETRYPALLGQSTTSLRLTSQLSSRSHAPSGSPSLDLASSHITTSSSSTTLVDLDLVAVVKASQAIGSEIILEQLLRNLMQILIANAGAQRGMLLRENQGQLLIEAASEIDAPDDPVLQTQPLGDRVPLSVINYVARTSESVLLHHATLQGNFTSDPYIQQHQSKSILCFPLIHQGQVVSIVYLENNLSTAVFTPERWEILHILSSQAAISIENARLYHTLEDKVEERTAELANANAAISALNQQLQAENLRMGAELDITRRMQDMILPKAAELSQIPELDIAGLMEPATEVGGDYYDVLTKDGHVVIGIGDVTGHGLDSGILMIMVQTAVRNLIESQDIDVVKYINVLNQTIYANVQRTQIDKTLSLALLHYHQGLLRISGQHEEIIVVRAGGTIERIDTIDLGFPIGLIENITAFIAQTTVRLQPGDGVVLYTDGITEAENRLAQHYGLARLCDVVSRHWHLAVADIRQAIAADLWQHIGTQKVFDDITLVVFKQK